MPLTLHDLIVVHLWSASQVLQTDRLAELLTSGLRCSQQRAARVPQHICTTAHLPVTDDISIDEHMAAHA
jgi:hypothetical protein